MSNDPSAPDTAPVLAAAAAAGVTLHPQAVQFLALVQHNPPLDTQSAERNRADLDAALPLAAGGSALPSVEDALVPGPGGDIAVRVYRPSLAKGLPAVVYAHGGGWVLADLELHDGTCRDIAAQSGAVVVAVDYRKAPEHPFPAAFEDCLAVTEHLLGGGFDVDGSRVALVGDSAGGNLAAALALQLRGAQRAPIHQVLMYPVVAASAGTTESYVRFAEGFFLTRRDMEYFYDQYAAGCDRQDPRLAPATATDLAGSMAATVVLAEADPLVDEGRAYAQALVDAGVEVELRIWPGQVHPFVALGAFMDDAAEARAYIAGRLADAFGAVTEPASE